MSLPNIQEKENRAEPKLKLNINRCNPGGQLHLLGLRGEAPKPDFANTLYEKRISSKRVYQPRIVSYASKRRRGLQLNWGEYGRVRKNQAEFG